MNRLMPIVAALAVLTGPMVMGGEALAKDHGGRGADHGKRGGGGDWRGDGERRVRDERRGGYDGPIRGGATGWREDRGGPDRRARRSYDEAPAQYAPSPRRGGYMSPEAGGRLPDYGRYRLRPPPRGFVWVRTGNGFAMVSTETGRVFDVVPN
jgi:Ni/Co efflux regulator RcnB